MTKWNDPEEVRLYNREWYKRKKAGLPTKRVRIPSCFVAEDSYSDIYPNRPIDPAPDPTMRTETWEALEDFEEMSSPGDRCYQMVLAEKARRLARLDRVIPDPKLVRILLWSDVKTIIYTLTSDQYRRWNPTNPWWICKTEIFLALQRAGWVEQKGSRRFLPAVRSKLVCGSRALDRVIRDPYEYYPIDMMEQVKAMPEHQMQPATPQRSQNGSV